MKNALTCVALFGIAIAVSAPAALAQSPAHGSDASTSGNIILQQTEKAQHEPGVTSELAPDAKQTATGGPSGGVPGFSK